MRRKRFLALVFGLFIGLLPISGSLWFARDNWRNDRMVKLQHMLDDLQLRDNLPATLSVVPSLKHLSAGPFGIDCIGYKLEGNNYVISSHNVPMGPFELYSSEHSEWYYEE